MLPVSFNVIQEELTQEQMNIVRKLRFITLNGMMAIRQVGCTDCRIAHYFSKCDCEGIRCTNPQEVDTKEDDGLTLFFG